MGRKKTLATEEMIRLTDEYRLLKPNAKIKFPELAEFIRSKGFPIQAYTLRRDKTLVEYVAKLNNASDEMIYQDVVAFHPLDVEIFIQNNRSVPKMKQALATRDQYYAKIAAAAADSIKRRKQAEQELTEMAKRAADLEAKNAKIQKMEYEKKLKEKDVVISKLKAILDNYVYPDAANAMLEKEGILHTVIDVVAPVKMENMLITASTEVKKSRFAAINKMMGDFDE